MFGIEWNEFISGLTATQSLFMDKKERIARAIAGTIREIDQPAFKNYKPEDFRDVSLSGNLDSLGMVNLIIGVEDALKQEFRKDVPLLGRTDAPGTNPFDTVGTLIDYIDRIV